MYKVIIFGMLQFCSLLSLCQKNGIWIHYYESMNIGYNKPDNDVNNDLPPGFRRKDGRKSFRIDIERTLWQSNNNFGIGLNGVYYLNTELRSYYVRPFFNYVGDGWRLWGGGLNIRKKIYTADSVQFWLSNTTNILHLNHKDLYDFKYKVVWKNFVENKTTIEVLFKIKKKRNLALGLNYIWMRDTNYPEPWREGGVIVNPLTMSLGFQF